MSDSYDLRDPLRRQVEGPRLELQAEFALPAELAVLARHGLTPDARLVDVGCARGAWLAAVHREVQCPVGGIELNPEWFKDARARLPEAVLVEGDAADVTIAERMVATMGRPSMVVLRFVLQHLEPARQTALLVTIAQHLRAERVVVIEPDDDAVVVSDEDCRRAIRWMADDQARRGGDRRIGRAVPATLRRLGWEIAEHATIVVDADSIGREAFADVVGPVFTRRLIRSGEPSLIALGERVAHRLRDSLQPLRLEYPLFVTVAIPRGSPLFVGSGARFA